MGDIAAREIGARAALRDNVFRAARAAIADLDSDIDDWVVPVAVNAAFGAASVDDLFRVIVDHVGVCGVLLLLAAEPGADLTDLDPQGRWTLVVDTTGDDPQVSPR